MNKLEELGIHLGQTFFVWNGSWHGRFQLKPDGLYLTVLETGYSPLVLPSLKRGKVHLKNLETGYSSLMDEDGFGISYLK